VADPQAPALTAYKLRVNVRRQAAGRLPFTRSQSWPAPGRHAKGPAPTSMVGLGPVGPGTPTALFRQAVIFLAQVVKDLREAATASEGA
jgi:hypothetical protein